MPDGRLNFPFLSTGRQREASSALFVLKPLHWTQNSSHFSFTEAAFSCAWKEADAP